MNIKPVGQKLLVKPLPKQEEKFGSLVIPGTANAELEEAEIIEVSTDIESIFKKGEHILYASSAGVSQMIDKITYKWLIPDQVWAIVEGAQLKVV